LFFEPAPSACENYTPRLVHFFSQSFAFGLCSPRTGTAYAPRSGEGLVTPTCTALRRRIFSCEQVLDFLDAVAMHPQARDIIATAKADLDTVSRRLTRGSDAAALDSFDASLSLVETRLERMREAIAAAGPLAPPPPPQD
jgi:hypothetical protein